MKKQFVFDPNLTSAVRLAGALDGVLSMERSKEDSVRSQAMVAVARWTLSKSATIREIESETGVHRGTIQRYSAIGKALLTSAGGSVESHEGAADAHTLMRAAGDLPGTTLGKVLAAYAEAYPSGTGSWAVMAAWASEFIEANTPVEEPESEVDSDESESDEDESGSTEPRAPRTYEDRTFDIAEAIVKVAKPSHERFGQTRPIEEVLGDVVGWLLVGESEGAPDAEVYATLLSTVREAYATAVVAVQPQPVAEAA
jgi:hypothetical protein